MTIFLNFVGCYAVGKKIQQSKYICRMYNYVGYYFCFIFRCTPVKNHAKTCFLQKPASRNFCGSCFIQILFSRFVRPGWCISNYLISKSAKTNRIMRVLQYYLLLQDWNFPFRTYKTGEFFLENAQVGKYFGLNIWTKTSSFRQSIIFRPRPKNIFRPLCC
jgi:hypothetical protein